MNLQVISACFYADVSPARRLIQSCQRFGLPLHLYGVGEPCKSWFDAKVTRLIQELEKLDADVVLYTDAADSFLVAPLPDIDCVEISGERNCWPDGTLSRLFDFGRNSVTYKYPNAGGFCGPRLGVIENLSALPEVSENDQECWHHAYRDHCGVYAAIDGDAEIFQTMDGEILGGTLAKRSDGRLVNLYTMTTPSIVHFNGGNKEARMAEFEAWFNG